MRTAFMQTFFFSTNFINCRYLHQAVHKEIKSSHRVGQLTIIVSALIYAHMCVLYLIINDLMLNMRLDVAWKPKTESHGTDKFGE